MSFDIVLRAKAERAIAKAAAWYRKDNPDSARAFLLAVDRSIEKMAANPTLYPVVEGETRRVIVKGFPYSLLYRLSDTKAVITNCVHFRRHPRHWRA